MKVHPVNNTDFSGLYVSKSLNCTQEYTANRIVQSLCKSAANEKSYVDKIKDIGYDVLIIKPEFHNPKAVRLCIIDDMKKHRLASGGYDYLDAKVISEESYYNFSAQDFYNDIVQRTSKSKFSLKKCIEKLFNF